MKSKINFNKLLWRTVVAHNHYVVTYKANATERHNYHIVGQGEKVPIPETMLMQAHQDLSPQFPGLTEKECKMLFASYIIDRAIKDCLIYHPFDESI